MVSMTDHLPFPQPPAHDAPRATAEVYQSIDETLAATSDKLDKLEALIAERDRAVAEAKRLREERDARGLRRVVGAIGEGLGAAVALTLGFGALVVGVGALYLAARAVLGAH